MEEQNKNNYLNYSSFYHKFIQDDENMQAKIRPILNQIQENRVVVKELHIQYGMKFSEMITSYKSRLEDLSNNYEKQLSDLRVEQCAILNKCNELLEDLKKIKP